MHLDLFAYQAYLLIGALLAGWIIRWFVKGTNRRGVIVVGSFLLAWLLYRPVIHFFCIPWATYASWVDEHYDRGLLFDQHLPDDFAQSIRQTPGMPMIEESNRQKRKLYEMFKSGNGHYGLYRRLSTVEGDPIYDWLIVENGKMFYIEDASHDDGAPPWHITKRAINAVHLGFLRSGKFNEGQPGPTDSPVLFLMADDMIY